MSETEERPPMTDPDGQGLSPDGHARKAEYLLSVLDVFDPDDPERRFIAAAAQVHATLSLRPAAPAGTVPSALPAEDEHLIHTPPPPDAVYRVTYLTSKNLCHTKVLRYGVMRLLLPGLLDAVHEGAITELVVKRA